MIPAADGNLNNNIQIEEIPSHTFYIDIEKHRIYGYAARKEAMKQAIYLCLNTERYHYVIVSRNYGVELASLFGKPVTYVIPEIKRRFSEALTHDNRIIRLEDWNFEVNKNVVTAQFTAVTVYGNLDITKAVTF